MPFYQPICITPHETLRDFFDETQSDSPCRHLYFASFVGMGRRPCRTALSKTCYREVFVNAFPVGYWTAWEESLELLRVLPHVFSLQIGDHAIGVLPLSAKSWLITDAIRQNEYPAIALPLTSLLLVAAEFVEEMSEHPKRKWHLRHHAVKIILRAELQTTLAGEPPSLQIVGKTPKRRSVSRKSEF